MALNPIAYTENVVRSFLRYQLTAYPFADPHLHSQMRRLLSLDETRQSPLLKGPYVSLSRPFRQGASVASLVAEGLLHPHLGDRIPPEITHLYSHQERAIRAIAEGWTTLVSTGTGSGKTECFLYPIISRCLALRDEEAPPGISAVIVYPMNALAEDQLMRLRGVLAGTGIPFGIYVGKTPERETDVAGVRLRAGASRADYEARLARARREGSGETVYPGEEVCSREVMRTPGRQPRILLTNVKQLELLLTRQQDIELFSGARLDYLVFDNDGDGAPHARTVPLHFCRRCGTAHPDAVSRCRSCGTAGTAVQLHAVRQSARSPNPGSLTSCLSCGSAGHRVGGRYREPARTVRAITVSDVHVLTLEWVREDDDNYDLQLLDGAYPVCTVCGQSVSPLSSERQREEFREAHAERCRRPTEAIGFYAGVTADALTLPACDDATTAYSVLEALRFGAARVLDMHMDDLQILVIGHFERDSVDAVLWDPIPTKACASISTV